MVSAVANEAVVSLAVVDSALDMVVLVGSMLGMGVMDVELATVVVGVELAMVVVGAE